MRLLLVEDEKSLARAVAAILQKNNYSVDVVYDGQEALDYMEAGDYDGVVLDVTLPKLNGIEVVKTIRSRGDITPVIMLTARSEIEDKVRGLDSGANDYLTKPFAAEELLARIRAMSRGNRQQGSKLSFGNVILDCSCFELSTSKGKYRLPNKEFQMMEMLMRNSSCLISSDRFFKHVWGYDNDADLNVVWVYISYLRKKLTALDADICIKAVRNTGYFLEKNE